jgi:hypothetical protein
MGLSFCYNFASLYDNMTSAESSGLTSVAKPVGFRQRTRNVMRSCEEREIRQSPGNGRNSGTIITSSLRRLRQARQDQRRTEEDMKAMRNMGVGHGSEIRALSRSE